MTSNLKELCIESFDVEMKTDYAYVEQIWSYNYIKKFWEKIIDLEYNVHKICIFLSTQYILTA